MSTTTLTATATSPVMLSDPSSSSELYRVVRFDSECVLIPESSRSKRPRMLTKSYSLPLWKQKPQQSTDSASTEENILSPASPPSPEGSHVVLKLPIPTFTTKPSRSTRGRNPSSPTSKPCLVHRSPSAHHSGHSSSVSPVRRTSLPIYHRPKVSSELTVPLRACCQDCERITDEALEEGDSWQEKFSRGANRRRSSSLDNPPFSFLSPLATTGKGKGFTAVATTSAKGNSEPAVISNSRFPTSTSAFSITVDEVDKRRKSQEFSDGEASSFCTLPSPSSANSSPVVHSPLSPFSKRSHLNRPNASDSSEDIFSDASGRKPRSSPIQEEDETQLFPLPSPRRSPNASPSPSLNLTLSPRPSPSASPSLSPNPSSSCLDVNSVSSSRDSVASETSSTEVILKTPILRKDAKTNNGYLTPFSSNHRDTTTTDATPKTPTPSSEPGPTPKRKASPLSISLPMFSTSSTSAPGRPSPPNMEVFPSAKSTSTESHSPTTFNLPRSPKSPSKQRKLSFTIPFLKAGIDVLKGVNSIGAGGGSMLGGV